MKITITKLFALLVVTSALICPKITHAQTVLYSNNFDAPTDEANKPALPKGWTSNTPNPNKVDSNWVLDSIKISNNPGASGHTNLYIDSKTSLLNQDLTCTFSGVSTKGYKNITLFWDERYSAKYLIVSHNRLRVDYSVDNGKTWDSTQVLKKDTTGGSLWFWANDSTPIVLPAKASDQANLMVRFVAYIVAAGGNYVVDNFSISGTKLVTGIDENTIVASDIKSWYANGALNIRFDDNTSKQAEISIYNLKGTQVYHNNGRAEGDVSIQLNSLTPGMYIAKIITNQNTYTSRFVK